MIRDQWRQVITQAIAHWGRLIVAIVLLWSLGFSLDAAIAIVDDAPTDPIPTAAVDSLNRPDSSPIEMPISDISSEKIGQFVRAYVEVVDLINQRETELQRAETDLESQRIQADILQAAFAKIEATGLTRQEYLQLLGLANTDPEFGERIALSLEEMP